MDYKGSPMLSRFEQVILYSKAEYHRRAELIRRVMKDAGVQVTIFLECAEEAYDEWLTGRRMLEYVIVPEQGEILGVLWNEVREEIGAIDHAYFSRLIMQKPSQAPEGVRYINRVSDDRIADILLAAKPERIGVVLPQQMNAGLAAAIQKKMPKAELVDVTIPVALARAPKSEEELYVIQQARDIQVAAYEALPQMVRIGRNVEDIGNELTYLLHSMGASGVVHGGLMCNGQQDVPLQGFGGLRDHKVEYGDRFFALMEANGPGHHHIAFGRHFVIGDPTPSWQKCVSDAIAIHKYAVSLMQPGNISLAQIAVKTRKFCNRMGYTLRESVGWNWMHSLGGYYYEQFSLEDYTEDIPLRENILLHCHPLIYREFPGTNCREDLFILNTYQVTAQGAVDLVDVPLDLQVLY